jgi:hypothetical protein
MRSSCKVAVAALLVVLSCSGAFATDEKPKRISDETRKVLIRELMAEAPYVRRVFPMGKVGLRVQDGVVSPSDAEVQQLVANSGPAAKPGDRARITALIFKKDSIIFEINGGPVKRKKWYERISLESAGGSTTPANPKDQDPNSVDINARGSYVALSFKDYLPDLTSQQVKQMLSPVLDFNARSQAEAYAKSLPPKLQEALKNHHAMVGMDREMVTYAKGRPPKKHRENDNGVEYEEWIYGEPPNEVEFIRFIGDKVARIETMGVDGEKVVRTQKEVDLGADTVAKKDDKADEAPAPNAPSLIRPGERPIVDPNTTVVRTTGPGATKSPNGPGAPGPTQGPPQSAPPVGPPHM